MLPRPPSYCEHKARDLAYVRIDGQQIYLGRWDSPESHVAYDEKIAEWRKRQNPGRYSLTMADLALKYLEYAPTYYRKHGVNTGRKVQRLSPVEMCNAHNPCSLILTIETSFMRWSV